MKWAWRTLRLIVAASAIAASAILPARGDYLTFDIASHEAMADYTRFESRSWAADAVGEGGRLERNTVWSGDEHVIVSDIYIPSGVTLTINAGTVVKFCEGTRIKVEDGGSLVINGASGNEVVLEGYNDETVFTGIVLQSSAASYSDNTFVIVRGFNFSQYATVSLNNTTAFLGGGQALVPVDVSGSRDTVFSFDWVAETNGVTFASGTMSWNRVSDGRKNITVPYPDGLPGCSNFVIRAVTFRCCSPSASECIVTLSEFITSDILCHEAMADYIAFESREWAVGMAGEGGRLATNATWSGTHKIVSDVYIPSGVTLTLTADTVVEFCEGTRIKIEDGGTLNIVGADGHDVILRGAEGVANFVGIVKMPNGTFTDNSYFRFEGFAYGALANVALHDSSTFRSSGLALIPVTVSGSRSTAFSIDWVAETNGVPYKTGTLKWNGVSEGTKNISINYGAELDGYTNFTLRAAVDRACKTSPSTCTIKISDFIVSDIASHESMADSIRFESREWAADLEGEGGRLAANATWEGTHKIASDVYIPSGVTLTLAADAVVEFYEGARIKIEDGGTLNIVGANGHDVIIRGAAGVTNYVGIVKMPNGTYTDNMYVQYTDKPYSAYPYITVNEATTYREAGKMWIAFSLSGSSRNQSFNVDWSTDKGDSGTLTWSSSSDGTKWIEIPIAAEPVGGTTNHVINVTAARGCNISVGTSVLTVLEPDYNAKGQVALTECDAQSNEFAVNGGIKTQPLFLSDIETVQYSGKWQPYDENEAALLRVTLETDNGATVLKEASPSETGAFDLDLTKYPVGYYTLKHEVINDFGETLATMQKSFSIADEEDVELHGGTLKQNEVWSADKVHVVYETVVVPSIYTIFIEPGAIVKFMTGTGIDISQGGAFFANRIVFTHINDDTVGGDTLNDGFTVAPPMDAYYLAGAFTFGDDTELRGITQNNALTGTIATQKTLSRGSTYRVSGTLTIASGGSLTIPPGTVLKMEAGSKIDVAAGGSLISKGTRASPIVITSIKDDSYSGDTNADGSNSRPAGGDWQGIWVSGKADFEYTTMMYAGKGNERGIVETRNSGALLLNNCIVAHAEYDGIWNWGGTIAATNTVVIDTGYATAPYRGSLNEYVNCVFYGNNVGLCYWSHWSGNPTYRNCIFNECGLGWCELGGSSHGDPPSSVDVANCVFWNPVGYGLQSCGRAGSNGNIWGDPLFVDPVNGDFRVKEGSPCVDAADGAVAPELDFYGQPRITITDHGDELVGQLADIGICEVMPRDVVSDIDLVPQSVRTTTNAVPGQLLFVKWEIANVGGREVDAAWRDTISLVSESGREVVLGDKTTSSRIGVGGSVFCSGYFTVPAISEGTWYPKVNVNSYHDIFEGSLAANNALTGERAVSVGLEALDPSISREGVINGGIPTVLKLAFGEGDANRMVKFDVPAGVKATWGFGFMPGGSRSVATASGFMTATSDGVMFRVPDGATDVYVVLESDTTTTYNLSTETTKMTITGVTPATLPSSGTTTLTIAGAGFGEANEVSLVSAVGRAVLSAPQKDASGNLIATVDCAALTAGQSYAVRVESGANAAELPGAVSVVKAEGKGILELEYDVPSSVRPGRVFTFTVTYRNTGNKDMCVPLLTVQDTGNDTQNPIQFSLDGERFMSGGFQFVGNDAEGGFGPLHPGDEVTLLLMAKIPPANNGSTAVSVRANTESDIMAKYTTEIDRYLTPAMKAEFAATTDAELKARGERMVQVFGANNGEMVQNFAALAKRFVECNGFALQKVDELVPYGMDVKKENENAAGVLSGLRTMESNPMSSVKRLLSKDLVNSQTGAYLYPEMAYITEDTAIDLSNCDVAVIAHGRADGKDWRTDTSWMRQIANALLADNETKIDKVLIVDWSSEASAKWDEWLRRISNHIADVAPVVASQLKLCKVNPQRTTLIGHSFGSHLLGHVTRQKDFGKVKRHIGLDTAQTLYAVKDTLEVDSGVANKTEYYRTSPVYGRMDAYAHENFIVSAPDRFYTGDNGDKHSYACTWFSRTIDSAEAKANGVGFWRADVSSPIDVYSGREGFIGVINGEKQQYECIYPHVKSEMKHKLRYGFAYPGNQVDWIGTLANWSTVADMRMEFVDWSPVVKIGVPKDVRIRVVDDCTDIETCSRSFERRIAVALLNMRTGQKYSLKSDWRQFGEMFDYGLWIPPDWVRGADGPYCLKFSVSHGSGALNEWRNYKDLHEYDNEVEIPISFVESNEPVAVINEHAENDFTIRHEIVFEDEYEYVAAVKSAKMFDFTFDGSKSIAGGSKEKIKWYIWKERLDGLAIGQKASLNKEYSATRQMRYPILLTIANDSGAQSTVRGHLEVIPIVKKKGQPIEQPRSYDPNEMRGPLGLGDPETERFVKPGEWLTYTIYFENQTNATAAAQEVYVSQALSANLDWSTFEMAEVAFGDQIDLGLAGKNGGSSDATMTGTNLIVRTSLALDETTGLATWYLRIVDPTADTGWPKDILAGFLPPNDPETHCGEGHITYRVKVREDAPPHARINAAATIVFDYNEPIITDPSWWNTVSPVEGYLQAGEYFKATLEELGYDVPTDGKMPYTVKAFGLPAGLKLMSNKAVKDKKGKITKKANVEWWIEGVPTAALDFFTNPPYLVITVDGDTRTEMLPVDVKEQEVIDLGELELGQSINTNGWLTGVGAGWTVSGLPTGLKYATKKVTKTTGSGKKKVSTTVAEAYAVYGKTTKAGLFTITAKQKVNGYYETLKYRVLVKPAPVDTALFGEELTNITTMAYVPFEWDLTNDVAAVGGKVAKVAGLPAGLAFASATTYKDKKKTQVKQYGQTIVGTPTKPGTYVVTFTKNVTTGTGKNKKTVAKTAQILWTVVENDAELELAFNIAGGVIEGGSVGLKYGDLMAFTATDGAAVTASGLPKGIALANLGDGNYAFTGFTEKAGTYLVAVKATLNGKTVTQRMVLEVDGLPSWAKGTFNGYIAGVDGVTNGLATITVSSVGKISGKFQEGGTNWTFTAASYTGYDNAAPAYSVPVVAKYSYKEKEKVKVKGKWTTKTVTKYVTRDFTLRVGQDVLGGVATLEEVDGSTVEAWQNLWGSTYKAIGKKLFYTSAKKPYRVFTINAASDVGAQMGLLPTEKLSLKVTTAGAVTATMSFDTGKTSKGKPVIYKTTCSTVVIPLSAADAEEFEGEAILFFAPSSANGFPGFAGAAPF